MIIFDYLYWFQIFKDQCVSVPSIPVAVLDYSNLNRKKIILPIAKILHVILLAFVQYLFRLKRGPFVHLFVLHHRLEFQVQRLGQRFQRTNLKKYWRIVFQKVAVCGVLLAAFGLWDLDLCELGFHRPERCKIQKLLHIIFVSPFKMTIENIQKSLVN